MRQRKIHTTPKIRMCNLVLRGETPVDVVQPVVDNEMRRYNEHQYTNQVVVMPVEIDGVRYFVASEVAEVVRISRQTLWRWRRRGSIPMGKRSRDRHVLFTWSEVEAIQDFANKLEPDGLHGVDRQLKLFDRNEQHQD